jgi:hypothetical protein
MVIRVQAKRAIFKPAPYDTRRGSRGLPGWLILFIVGILLGGGGVLFLQASYGEKRLSLAETQKLTEELKTVTVEKQSLQKQFDIVQKSLDNIQKEHDQQVNELQNKLSTAESLIGPLREQLNLFAKTLPFDPRYGPVGVSTSLFTQERKTGKISYLVWLMQENAQRPQFKGWLELSFEGRYANGRVQTISIPRIEITLNHYLHVNGTADLPEGFVVTRANAKILSEDGKRQVTWRILPVQVQ